MQARVDASGERGAQRGWTGEEADAEGMQVEGRKRREEGKYRVVEEGWFV